MGERGLARMISALLAASSFVGQASAANVKKPAGEVKVGKNVVRKKHKRKPRSAEIDVGGRERRGEAINAYAGLLDNPRNWVDYVLGMSTLGSGGAALHYYNKASGNPQAVLSFSSRACSAGVTYMTVYDRLVRGVNADGLLNVVKTDGVVGFFAMDDNGKLGSETTDFKKKCYYGIGDIYGGPVYRTLDSDVGVCVDYLLVGALGELRSIGGLLSGGGIIASTLKDGEGNIKDGKCVTSFREHLRNACDKFLNTGTNIAGDSDAQKKENLAKAKAEIARIFKGAEILEETLRSRLSGLAKNYDALLRPKMPPPTTPVIKSE